MAKLYFRYGAMNSSKTANALMVKYNYEERGQKVLLMKPSVDNRDGGCIIKSRAGLTEECLLIHNDSDVYRMVHSYINKNAEINCVIVDEAQFLTKQQVYHLTRLVDHDKIPVICYGLRADFRGELFEGSQYLLAWADTIEEIKTICWCGKKAIMNARYQGDKIIKEGEQVEVGGNDRYISLCRSHWHDGVLSGK
ncbi:thymidine kinase [Ruminiclostridium cellobioparum]|jgi:thymidine kinase|uniref:thymidine kinase n=1 Tax=Ruminiclostridium cellobioparum TaxID=29355 RepID=UPI0028AA3529|nr:thymidine kinase [Ruminiclostridium cellobioparum]